MKIQKQPHRISITMLLDELEDYADEVHRTREEFHKAVEARNEAISELKAAGIPDRTIMRVTGLSRDSVHKISQGARKAEVLEIENRVGYQPPKVYNRT